MNAADRYRRSDTLDLWTQILHDPLRISDDEDTRSLSLMEITQESPAHPAYSMQTLTITVADLLVFLENMYSDENADRGKAYMWMEKMEYLDQSGTSWESMHCVHFSFTVLEINNRAHRLHSSL